jgi:hypothetical protein
MKRTRLLLLSLVAVGTVLFFVGCDLLEEDEIPVSADLLFASGMNDLQGELTELNLENPIWDWDVNVSGPLSDFEDALDADPEHCGALLMAGLTRLIEVVTDPDLADILEDIFGGDVRASHKFPLMWYVDVPGAVDAKRVLQSLDHRRQDPFEISLLQEYIEDEVIPALEYTEGNLMDFQDLDCEVNLEIPIEDASRDTMWMLVDLDATDVAFAMAPLHAIMGALEMIVAYNMDVTQGQTLEELLTTDPDFLSLRAGSHMPTAFGYFSDIHDDLSDACTMLQNETGDQTFDLITELYWDGGMYIVLEDMFGPAPCDTIRAYADLIYDALNEPIVINPSDEEPGAPDIDITIDVSQFFNDPLDPLTDYFPEFVPVWPDPNDLDGAFVEPVNFPDPTFEGILPGMSNAEWQEIIDWLDET